MTKGLKVTSEITNPTGGVGITNAFYKIGFNIVISAGKTGIDCDIPVEPFYNETASNNAKQPIEYLSYTVNLTMTEFNSKFSDNLYIKLKTILEAEGKTITIV